MFTPSGPLQNPGSAMPVGKGMSRQSPDRRSGGAYFPLPKLFNREPKKEARPHRPAPSLLLHFGVPFFVPCRFRLPCLRHALFPDCHNDALYNQEQTQHRRNGNTDPPGFIQSGGRNDVLNRAQKNVPIILPTPPVSIVPPIIDEAMAFISAPLAWDGEPEPTCRK